MSGSLLSLIAGRLRAALLRLSGVRIAAKSNVGARVVIIGPRGITLGKRVTLEHDVYLKLVTPAARVTIGEMAFVGRGCELDVAERVTIGAHTLLAPNVFITDHRHNIRAGVRINDQGVTTKPVTIGEDVWIGTGSVILPGVTIGDGAIVGALSVVTHDVEPNAVVKGAPARLLRYRGENE